MQSTTISHPNQVEKREYQKPVIIIKGNKRCKISMQSNY
jgi:hypothetical protein